MAELVRSDTDEMCFGLPACTAISSLLCANTVGAVRAKLNFTSRLGYFAWSWVPIFVYACVSEAAASTLRLPEYWGVGLAAGRAATPPQAASSTTAVADIRTDARLIIRLPPPLTLCSR